VEPWNEEIGIWAVVKPIKEIQSAKIFKAASSTQEIKGGCEI